MTMYLSQASYTPEALAAQIRNPQDRIEILRPALEKAGGRLVVYGYVTSPPGLMVVVDWPDDLTAEVSALTVFSNGAFAGGGTNVRLLDGQQWVQLLTATQGPAGEYIPPGQT